MTKRLSPAERRVKAASCPSIHKKTRTTREDDKLGFSDGGSVLVQGLEGTVVGELVVVAVPSLFGRAVAEKLSNSCDDRISFVVIVQVGGIVVV